MRRLEFSLPKFSLPMQVLCGAILGIASGLIFGRYNMVFQPVGDIYIMLMRVVVYPYLVCTIIVSIGLLNPKISKRLFLRGVIFYLLMIVVTVVTIWSVAQLLPLQQNAIVDHIVTQQQSGVFAVVYKAIIPSNLIVAITHNYVPAIVIFSVLFGVTLQFYSSKQVIINVFNTVRRTCIFMWQWIVKFSPLAIFALLSHTVGTLNLANAETIAVYLILFYVLVFVLSFWLLPALLSSITPIKYWDVIAEIRDGMLIAVATTLSVAALPYIERAIQRFIRDYQLEQQHTKEIIATSSNISYPIAQIGNMFLYLYMLFAVIYFHSDISRLQLLFLPLVSVLSSIGSPSSSINAAAFLASWLQLPSLTTSLYVELMSITRFAQVIVSVMGMLFLSATVVFAYFGKIKIQLRKLFLHGGLFIAFIIIIVVIAPYLAKIVYTPPKSLFAFQLDPTLTKGIQVNILTGAPKKVTPYPASGVFYDIKKSGLLRVGFDPSRIPFVYYNNKHQLVGFDIAMMYALAKTLHVKLELIPYSAINLISDIKKNKFDIAIGGIILDPKRLTSVAFSTAYYKTRPALLVWRDYRKQVFQALAAKKLATIGVLDEQDLLATAKRFYPHSKIVPIPLDASMLNYRQYKAILCTTVFALAYKNMYPQKFVVVEPNSHMDTIKLTIAYVLNEHSYYLRSFLNYWLQLAKEQGMLQYLQNYWLQQQMTQPKKDYFQMRY